MFETRQTGVPWLIATVVEKTATAIDASIASAAVAGADAVEVRFDACPEVDPGACGLGATIPILASCRSIRDGGAFAGSEGDRVGLLERAARTGRFRLDVERGSGAERLAEKEPGWVAVLSHHDWQGTPPDLAARAHDLLGALRPGQIAKLVPTASSPADLLAVRDLLTRDGGRGLACFAMGEAGMASRVLAGVWGSAALWAAARSSAPGAPGQIGLADMLRLYRFRSLSSATRLFAVAGRPVIGSLSPAIHNAAFLALGLDAVYFPLTCDRAADLADFVRSLPLDGVSITVPLKIGIVPFLEEADPAVHESGACNTLVAGRGFNTDGPAALEEIRARIDPAGRPVTVIGAGGAARAVAFALHRAGARLTIATRAGTTGGGAALARELGARYVSIDKLTGDADTILVQATSAPPHDPVIPPSAVRAAFLLDLRYRGTQGDAPIALLEAAARAGIPAADGLGMLIRQAAAQVRLFTGRDVPVEVLHAAVRARGEN